MGVLEAQEVKLPALPWGTLGGAVLSEDGMSAMPHTTQALRRSIHPRPPRTLTAAQRQHLCSCKGSAATVILVTALSVVLK